MRAVPALGISGAFKLFLSRFTSHCYQIKPLGYAHPVRVRGQTSDSKLVYQIFCRKQYPIGGSGEIRCVIDAGANVGYTSLYFAHNLPSASIVAIEPEPLNYAMLLENTKRYPNIIPLCAALWSSSRPLCLSNPDAESWAFQYTDKPKINGSITVASCTVPDIMREYGLDGIDLLKIDIEGGEKELFSQSVEWLSKVRNIMIEVHRGCWKTVFDALANYEYDCSSAGEILTIRLHQNSQV